MKAIKVGEVNYKEYKTEFYVNEKTARYLEDNKISLAGLLPEGWLWYEVELFEKIDKDNHKHFRVIYNGIISQRDFSHNNLKEEFFGKESLEDNTWIFKGSKVISGQKAEEYHVNFYVYHA